MSPLFRLLVCLAICCQACASLPESTNYSSKQIATGEGPEDLLLDTLSTPTPRLLVSCTHHRLKEKAPNGKIYAIDLQGDSLKSYPLVRVGEPPKHDFHPHGFDLVRQNGRVFLYVVSHNDAQDEHFVYKYEVRGDKLQFVASYKNALMNSPNTVVARKDGGFYISNDQGKRGNFMALLFRAKTGSIVYCDEQGSWAKVADKLAYPNGLWISPKERFLYVSTSRQHQLLKYGLKQDGNLVNQEVVTKLVGGDNIRLAPQDQILVPAHLRAGKFLAHANDAKKKSPTVVYSVALKTGKKTALYVDNGQKISGASTAILYNKTLYVAQVFDPFILQVFLP